MSPPAIPDISQIHISQLVVDAVDASSIALPAVQLDGAVAAALYALLALLAASAAVQCAAGCLLIRALRRRKNGGEDALL